MITVGRLSKLAGVTKRTIHHYDEIGLLKPSVVALNGYRGYDHTALVKLQQILLYKELGLSLAEIRSIVNDESFDVSQALRDHKAQIVEKIKQYHVLIETIDKTIEHIKGEKNMTEKQLFVGFTPEQEEKYAREAESLYDPQTVRQSNQLWKSYSKDKQQEILLEGQQIYEAMANCMNLNPDEPSPQALVQRWRDHMNYFWTPNLDQLIGLGEIYVNDERFTKNFEKIKPGLADFFLLAIKSYVSNQKGSE